MTRASSNASKVDRFTGETVKHFLAASSVLLLTVPPPPPPPSGPKHPPLPFILPDAPAIVDRRRPTYRPVH